MPLRPGTDEVDRMEDGTQKEKQNQDIDFCAVQNLIRLSDSTPENEFRTLSSLCFTF